uniref:C2H2-type domain-containing protein n=1 Tax=Heterorhabditis bacteriophora TaxID=37862 RepID=A0A1I7WU16_HETBA
MDEDGQSYSCTKCKQVIQDVDAFVEHVIEKHGINRPLTSEKSLYAWALKCPLCIHSLYFDSIDSLLYHAECSHDGRELMLKMVLHSFHVKKKFITILRPAYEENSRTWIKLMLDELPPMSTPSTSVSNGANYREIDSTEKKRTPESKSKVHKFCWNKHVWTVESASRTNASFQSTYLIIRLDPFVVALYLVSIQQEVTSSKFYSPLIFTKFHTLMNLHLNTHFYSRLNGHLRRTHANDFPSGCCSEENGTKSESQVVVLIEICMFNNN